VCIPSTNLVVVLVLKAWTMLLSIALLDLRLHSFLRALGGRSRNNTVVTLLRLFLFWERLILARCWFRGISGSPLVVTLENTIRIQISTSRLSWIPERRRIFSRLKTSLMRSPIVLEVLWCALLSRSNGMRARPAMTTVIQMLALIVRADWRGSFSLVSRGRSWGTGKGRNSKFSWGRLWCVQSKGSRVGLVSREIDSWGVFSDIRVSSVVGWI
jgi:hypothetical protein